AHLLSLVKRGSTGSAARRRSVTHNGLLDPSDVWSLSLRRRLFVAPCLARYGWGFALGFCRAPPGISAGSLHRRHSRSDTPFGPTLGATGEAVQGGDQQSH